MACPAVFFSHTFVTGPVSTVHKDAMLKQLYVMLFGTAFWDGEGKQSKVRLHFHLSSLGKNILHLGEEQCNKICF